MSKEPEEFFYGPESSSPSPPPFPSSSPIPAPRVEPVKVPERPATPPTPPAGSSITIPPSLVVEQPASPRPATAAAAPAAVSSPTVTTTVTVPLKPARLVSSPQENMSAKIQHIREAATNEFTATKKAFDDTLYSDRIPKVNAGLKKFEEKTGQKREYLAYVVLVLVAIYLIFGEWAELATNLIGFAYPAVASLKALGTANKDDDRQWLVYWTVFGFFTFFDFFIKDYFVYFPLYYVIKAAFLVYLHLPKTFGALKIYENFLKRFVPQEVEEEKKEQ